jgi:hypothetical protein
MYNVFEIYDTFYIIFSYLNSLLRKMAEPPLYKYMDTRKQFQVQIIYYTIIPNK